MNLNVKRYQKSMYTFIARTINTIIAEEPLSPSVCEHILGLSLGEADWI